jgi:hypothetical protein
MFPLAARPAAASAITAETIAPESVFGASDVGFSRLSQYSTPSLAHD